MLCEEQPKDPDMSGLQKEDTEEDMGDDIKL